MDVLNRLARTVRALEQDWSERQGTSPHTDLPYVAAGELAELIGDRATHDDALGPFFEALERALERGSPADRNLLIVGFLEVLQNRVLSGEAGAIFEDLMGPETLRAWRGLHDVWGGNMPATEFNRLVARPARMPDG